MSESEKRWWKRAFKKPASTIILSNRDRDLFLKMLENPPEPNEKLKKLFRKYSRMMKAE